MATTLGRADGSGATAVLVGHHARELADLAADAGQGEWMAAHVAALRDLAEYIASRPIEDQRIYTLYRLMAASGGSDAYQPGEHQQNLFGRLAAGIPAPENRDSLDELVGAAVDDYLEHVGGEAAGLRTELARVEGELATAREASERVSTLTDENAQLRAELEQAQARNVELEQHNTHLRSMHPAGGETTDWRALEGYQYIYEKVNAAGEQVYKVGWRDEEGKQRWKSAGPVLAEAIELRDLKHPELREAVAA